MLLGRGGGGGGGGRVEMVERARGGERERPVEVEGDGGVHGGEPRGATLLPPGRNCENRNDIAIQISIFI